MLEAEKEVASMDVRGTEYEQGLRDGKIAALGDHVSDLRSRHDVHDKRLLRLEKIIILLIVLHGVEMLPSKLWAVMGF